MTEQSEILVFHSNKLIWRGKTYHCAIGSGGFSSNKREGDGTTPVGRFQLRRVFYRADRLDVPRTTLPVQIIGLKDGWCDAPEHINYNQLMSLPFYHSHEVLWREDKLYDILVEISYNDSPVIPHFGSAIFFHLATSDYNPTKGCVAVTLPDMIEILKSCGPKTHMNINPQIKPPADERQK